MLIKGHAPGGGPIRYLLTSHSIDNLFDYCPRKFEFLNVWDKRPPRESSFAAEVGTALHNGWQAWLIARAEGFDQDKCEEKGYMALCRDYPWFGESQQRTSLRSFNQTALMLKSIIRSSEWNDWELIRVKDKGWAIEVPFLIKHASLGMFVLDATGETVMLATQGKIDAVLRHKRTGEVRGWDLKTTAKSKDLVRSEYTFSGQQVGYGEVINAALGLDAKNFSVWYLIARFAADEIPEIDPREYVKGEHQIEDYWLDKLDRLERMKKYAIEGRFPRANGGCNSYNSECYFLDICKSRDKKLIRAWFDETDTVPQSGYDWWIEMEA